MKWYANGNDNNEVNSNNIIFGTKYVPVVTLSAKNNKKLSKLLSKVFAISVFWNECNRKSKNKNTTNEYRNFLGWNFIGVNRLLFWFIEIEITIQKGIKAEDIYQKVLLNIMLLSTETRNWFWYKMIQRKKK